ncbi:MAG TPA: class I SAM-dependent methyltransferase [Acidimicrobiales bacterium]|jgi:methyltransferase (TIGR00027 family)|nr:class I SAM-dependent methyltransferase [Acidimicrobiales bacterium]
MRDGVASETARRVAAHRLRCPRVATPYGRPEDDEALSIDVATGVEVREGRLQAYLCRRTSFFDRVVVEAIDGGTRQLVTVGAGYDGRSSRYAHPSVAWYEVDHPATQADKRHRLARLGRSTAATTFVAVDLSTDPVGERLRDAGLRDEVATLFVLEGLVTYLDVGVLAGVLAALRAVAAPSSVLAISVGFLRSGADPDRAAHAAAFRDAVAAMGEEVRSELTVEDTAALLASSGWDPAGRTGPDDAGDAALGLLVTTAGGGP